MVAGYATAAAAAAAAAAVALQRSSQDSQSKRRVHAVEKSIGGSYDLRHELGQGAYAVVFHAVEKSTDTGVAVKVIDKKGLPPDLLEGEVRVHLAAGTHPNLVAIRDVVDTDKWLVLVLDECKEELFGQ